MGVTDKVKKLRAAAKSPVVLGQWHEDFAKVKKYAETNKVPMIAVWSNGDLCGHCVTFENCILDSKFKTWQKTCGCAMWLGLGSDSAKDNKINGAGYNFAWGAKKALKMYPFVRVYWKAGKVDVAKTGDELDGASSKGAAKVVKAFQGYLKAYKPVEPEPEKPVEPETPVDEGGCDNCEPEAQFVPPVLAYSKDKDGKCSLTVDGKSPEGLSEEAAKYGGDAYNQGKS